MGSCPFGNGLEVCHAVGGAGACRAVSVNVIIASPKVSMTVQFADGCFSIRYWNLVGASWISDCVPISNAILVETADCRL